jgi:hypothetical protein
MVVRNTPRRIDIMNKTHRILTMIILIGILVIPMGLLVQAQLPGTYELQFQVKDGNTNEFLGGVTVTVIGADQIPQTETTNLNGQATFFLPPGTYNYTTTLTGYWVSQGQTTVLIKIFPSFNPQPVEMFDLSTLPPVEQSLTMWAMLLIAFTIALMILLFVPPLKPFRIVSIPILIGVFIYIILYGGLV